MLKATDISVGVMTNRSKFTAKNSMLLCDERAKRGATIDVAKTQGCDLIVMTSHGYREIKRVLLGSQVKFDQAFDEMNVGFNQCHGAADRAFIVIRRPSYPSEFSNQQYRFHPSEGQK